MPNPMPNRHPQSLPRSLSLRGRSLHRRPGRWATCARAARVFALGLGLVLAGAGATGCASTVVRIHTSARLDARARWVILPVANYAEAAQAGERVEALLDTVLRIEGVHSLDRYPAIKDDEAHLLIGERGRYEESLAWARANHYDYAVSGSVEEWRYKSGNDAEPAVGLTVTVMDLSNNETLWSGSGARVGRGVDNASGVALVLVSSLLDEVRWK
jgi:hypothetical protein